MECTLADLAESQPAARIVERASQVELATLTSQLDAGVMLLADIVAQLQRPGRDPREDLPPPIFKKGVIKLDDLTQGMELSGTVLNVVDFGAFVDIGLHDTGLVHISQLANKFVRDPHEVVSVGDIVKVWVHEIDKTRRRVSLTMIPPGTPRTTPQKREKRKSEGRRPAVARPAAGVDAATAEQAAAAHGIETPQPIAASTGTPPMGDRRPRPPGKRPGGRRPPDRSRREEQQGRPPQPKFKTHTHTQHKPKPLVPLTNEMKAGKAPLRTFGDLKQFIELKSTEDTAPEQEAKPEG
jgi:uncharacterized protein